MKKKIFIINGTAGSGKTTFEEFCLATMEAERDERLVLDSIINPVKRVAFDKGWWDGKEKTPKIRKFLSDLKDVLTEYDNIPMKMLIRNVENAFILYGAPAAFIDMREAVDIKKFKEIYSYIYDIKTVLIRRTGDVGNAAAASNHADADVFDYSYDITVFNYGDIDELEETAELFVKTFILELPLPEEYYQRFDYV